MLEPIMKFLGKFLLTLVILSLVLLKIDPNYFDRPIGRAEAGLPADKAPGGVFATSVTFEATGTYAINTVLGAKDQSLAVQAELICPDGGMGMNQSFDLKRSPDTNGPVEWKSVLGASTVPGTYTLRLTQKAPGRVTVYFFQGPFIERMIVFPLAVALVLFILQAALIKRRHLLINVGINVQKK